MKGDITITIYDPSGDVRDFKVKEQIAYSDILLFQQCENGYVLVYYESYEPKVKVFSEEGRVKSAFHLPSGVSCCLLDEKQQLWVGLCDEGIYHDENPNGHSVWCFTLDGKQKEMCIDRKLEEMDVPVVDECYGLAEKNGLIYMLYYGEGCGFCRMRHLNQKHLISSQYLKKVFGSGRSTVTEQTLSRLFI